MRKRNFTCCYSLFLTLLVGAFLAFPGATFSQHPSDKLNPKKFNQRVLRNLVLDRINTLRSASNVHSLSSDSILTLAANNQVRYCLKASSLSHFQKKKKLKTPWNRVQAYGGIHPSVKELIAYVPELRGETYQQLAEAIFREFEKSKSSAEIMTDALYFRTGIRFAYDAKREAFYAVQVLSGIPWHQPETEIPNWSRKIKPSDPIYCDYFRSFDFHAAHLSNGITRKGNDLYLYYRNLNKFKQLLKDNNTSIAVDIVDQSQFSCSGPNLLHGSPGHDGVILLPLNRKKLLRKNLLIKKGEFLAVVGKVPAGLTGDLQFNTVLFRSARACKYSWPLPVDTDDLQPVYIPSPFDTTGAKASPRKLQRYLEFTVPFKVNKFEYKVADVRPLLDSVASLNKKIRRIEIRAYASVEGPTEINTLLQEERAKSIYAAIQTVQSERIGFRKFTSEDWTGFYRDVASTSNSWILNKSRSTIKDTLAHNLVLLSELEPVLSQHRRADIRVFLEEEIWDTMTPPAWLDSLQGRINTGNAKKALVLQTRMLDAWEQGDLVPDQFEAQLPLEAQFLPLLYNTLVVYEREKNAGTMQPPPFTVEELIALDETYAPARFLKAKSEIAAEYDRAEKSDTPPTRGLQKEIFWLEENGIDPLFTNKLNINFHLANARYARRTLDLRGLARSMNLIRKSFSAAGLSESETLRLAKFFNLNYLYQWSLNLMRPWVDHPERKPGEEMMFTFLKNAALYPKLIDEEALTEYFRKAAELNQGRVCEKVKEEFQLLRNEVLKEFICEICD